MADDLQKEFEEKCFGEFSKRKNSCLLSQYSAIVKEGPSTFVSLRRDANLVVNASFAINRVKQIDSDEEYGVMLFQTDAGDGLAVDDLGNAFIFTPNLSGGDVPSTLEAMPKSKLAKFGELRGSSVLSMRVPPALMTKLREEASKSGKSVSAFTRELLG